MNEGPFGKKLKRDSPWINITSLIDVMFLLLIFLVVTTTFNPHLGLSLNLPKAKSGIPQEITDRYKILLDVNGRIYFSKNEETHEVTFDELKSILRELKASKSDVPLLLESDAEVPFRLPMKIFDLAVELGFSGLTIATAPENGNNSEVGSK